MRTYTFKKLNYKPQGSKLEQIIKSVHFKKTVITAVIGGLVAYTLFFVTEGKHTGVYWNSNAFKDILMGLGIGIFLTNSPCARGKC